jgi:transcription antitermination factor NusA-like protein
MNIYDICISKLDTTIDFTGVMIGRQGAVIKNLSEASNCHMVLAEMNDPFNTKERIMVINGKHGALENLINVCF